MSLRTFTNNPSLGGFGNETSRMQISKPAKSRKRSRQKHHSSHAYRTLSSSAAESSSAGMSPPNKQKVDRQHVNILSDEDYSWKELEYSTCDAFAQIIKELVDNAVDACRMDRGADAHPHQTDNHGHRRNYKRVRVFIQESKSCDAALSETQELQGQYANSLLRVTVSDNGCGIENIDECVNAFQSTKTSTSDNTAGRYGIGLTLCLLHAQRLVPNSYASITSATESATCWTKITLKVDTDKDKVSCSNLKHIPKKIGEDKHSGTAVSVLLPGGESVKRAWPRLAEYLARFQLSLDLNCSIDVVAPLLSPIALSIKPQLEIERSSEDNWTHVNCKKPKVLIQNDDDLLSENDLFGNICIPEMDTLSLDGEDESSEINYQIEEMKRVERMKVAVSKYLERPIPSENITSHTHPIRRINETLRSNPFLEIFIIVYDKELETTYHSSPEYDYSKAHAGLIRFFNQVPLLDSSECLACGLYHSMVGAKAVWNSFGVDLKPSQEYSPNDKPHNSLRQVCKNSFVEGKSDIYRNLHMPIFDLYDTAHIAHYLRTNDTGHGLFQVDKGDDAYVSGSKRASQERCIQKHDVLLPVGARLGTLLVIAHVNANHEDVTFPSLSKGRLPMNDNDIKEAFFICLNKCLEKLQWKNPALFPSATILRKEQRDNRYVPLISSALASLSHRSSCKEICQTVMRWSDSDTSTDDLSQLNDHIMEKIDNRIRIILEVKENASIELEIEPTCRNYRNIKAREVNNEESDDRSTFSSNESLCQFMKQDNPPLTFIDPSHQKENIVIMDECFDCDWDDKKLLSNLSLSSSNENEKPQSSCVLSVASNHSKNTNGFHVYEEW